MSANENQNRIEAACWLRLGPQEPEVTETVLGPVQVNVTSNPIGFRSVVGFERQIGVVDPDDPLVGPVFLFLERQYTRADTVVQVSCINTADMDQSTPPGGVIYPNSGVEQPVPFVLPVNRRVLTEGPLIEPFTAEQVAEFFQVYDMLVVQVVDVPTSADVSITVMSVPKFDGVSEIVQIVPPTP